MTIKETIKQGFQNYIANNPKKVSAVKMLGPGAALTSGGLYGKHLVFDDSEEEKQKKKNEEVSNIVRKTRDDYRNEIRKDVENEIKDKIPKETPVINTGKDIIDGKNKINFNIPMSAAAAAAGLGVGGLGTYLALKAIKRAKEKKRLEQEKKKEV